MNWVQLLAFFGGTLIGMCTASATIAAWLSIREKRARRREAEQWQAMFPRHTLGDPIDFDDPADGVIVTRTSIEVRP